MAVTVTIEDDGFGKFRLSVVGNDPTEAAKAIGTMRALLSPTWSIKPEPKAGTTVCGVEWGSGTLAFPRSRCTEAPGHGGPHYDETREKALEKKAA